MFSSEISSILSPVQPENSIPLVGGTPKLFTELSNGSDAIQSPIQTTLFVTQLDNSAGPSRRSSKVYDRKRSVTIVEKVHTENHHEIRKRATTVVDIDAINRRSILMAAAEAEKLVKSHQVS